MKTLGITSQSNLGKTFAIRNQSHFSDSKLFTRPLTIFASRSNGVDSLFYLNCFQYKCLLFGIKIYLSREKEC